METHPSKADAAQLLVAARLVKELVDCDPAILNLMAIDKSGRVLAFERSARLAESEFLSNELVPKFGVLAKLVMGAAANATPLVGRMEFIVGAFKNEKILLMNLPEYDLALGLRIARSATAEYIYQKIAERLGTSD